MKFRELRQHFENHQLITTQDIRNAFGEISRVQFSRWESTGRLIRIRRGQYLLGSKAEEIDKELLANEIKNSYISLEYALNYHNLIPEVPQRITSVTTERSENVKTPLGTFIYHRVKPELFCGYYLNDSKIEGRKVKIASPTKAVFDWVYLGSGKGMDDFEEARLNQSELSELFQRSRFESWRRVVSNPAIRNRLGTFLSFLEKRC